MMRMDDFHNALRILLSLDAPDLEAAGVIRFGDYATYGDFRNDPFRWFLRADDDTARKLWAIIERRHEPMFRTTEGLRLDTEAAP